MITMVKMFEMNFVNVFVWILCGIVPVFSIQIQHCNETAKSVTVCRLVENYNYNPGGRRPANQVENVSLHFWTNFTLD